jgi:hypothetical protein
LTRFFVCAIIWVYGKARAGLGKDRAKSEVPLKTANKPPHLIFPRKQYLAGGATKLLRSRSKDFHDFGWIRCGGKKERSIKQAN